MAEATQSAGGEKSQEVSAPGGGLGMDEQEARWLFQSFLKVLSVSILTLITPQLVLGGNRIA